MANLEDNTHKTLKELKSIEHIMNNAYKIAKSSGIYMALDKKNWTLPNKNM